MNIDLKIIYQTWIARGRSSGQVVKNRLGYFICFTNNLLFEFIINICTHIYYLFNKL